MRNDTRTLVSWFLIGLVGFCACAVIITYFSTSSTSRDMILTEIAKSFIQLGAIGILGAAVKYAFDQISEFQRQKQADFELKRDFLNRLRKIRNTVRTVPYLIEEERSVEAYRKGMRELLGTRLEISDLDSDCRLPEFIEPYSLRIGTHLWTMLTFISKLLDEAAKNHPARWEDVIALPEFKNYRDATLDFLGSEESDKKLPYFVDFDIHYDVIKSELRLLMSGQRSHRWREVEGSVLKARNLRKSQQVDNRSLDPRINEIKIDAGTQVGNPKILYQVNFEYDYSVKGQVFSSKVEINQTFNKQRIYTRINPRLNNELQVGAKVKVYYDPNNPEISVVKLM